MKNIENMRIRKKILFGYIVMVVLCTTIGLITYLTLGLASRAGIVILILDIIAIVFALLYGITLSQSLIDSVGKIKHVIDELCLGHLSNTTNVTTKDEIGEMAQSLDKFNVLLKRDLIGAIEQISQGNIAMDFSSKDEKDEIAAILNTVSGTIKRINTGMGHIIQDVTDGDLEARGDDAAYTGCWKELVLNINGLIDAFTGPIHITSSYIDRISKGDIPAKITDTYKGDFNIIKENLNSCIDIMNGLLTETNALIGAAEQGKLDARGNSERYTGGWKELVEKINRLMETVVAPIREISSTMQYVSQGNLEVSVKGHYKGEFEGLTNAVNTTILKLHEVVEEISQTLSDIANGDITIENISVYDGNFESISISLKKIVDSLNLTLGEIKTAAEQVSTGSTQVADGSQLLAQGATEQASSIEELTASVTEIAAQTKENASNANEANSLVLQMKDSAVQGNGHMTEMLEAMTEINEASANISKVIKVIDDMAFQTNILALNAAVEAARAGQHGKGFAVVAEEVRNLAARSANAAKETTALIEGSIHKAQRGKEIANETAKALGEIVEGVSSAANLISGIAVSSNEQASGISQINIGINQVSQVVQTNSATSQESAAASEELSSQAELLKELVDQFQLKGSSRYMTAGKKKEHNRVRHESKDLNGDSYSTGKPQIVLSDNEFGKY